MRPLAAALLLPVLFAPRARAKDEEKPVESEASAQVEVTVTRYPDDPANLPGVVTVLDGQMLRDRGMTDLRSALGVVAGVDIAPGGDQGPASAVPEMWGLREFDAFLLVVDGVPWGGAFNPELPALSLRDVARIEILRGSAPVMYGATSFVGVIQVLHNDPGSAHAQAQVQGGTHGSYGADAAFDVGHWLGFDSRIEIDAAHQGYEDDRAEWTKAHALWRNLRPVGKGSFRFDLDLLFLDQFPTSPAPREGAVLSEAVPLDANHNPSDAKLDPRRGTVHDGVVEKLTRAHGAHGDGGVRNSLRDGEHVRHYTELLGGERRAESAETRNDFVEDEQDAVSIADLADAIEVAFGRYEHACRAGNGLEDHRGHS